MRESLSSEAIVPVAAVEPAGRRSPGLTPVVRRTVRWLFASALFSAFLGVVAVALSERSPAPVPASGGFCHGPADRAPARPAPPPPASMPKPAPGTVASLPVSRRSPCPPEMVHVSGEYCTAVRQTCKQWLDDKSLPFARCARYEKPARCVGRRVRMDFCIDRYEYTPPGEKLPKNFASFVIAEKTCRDLGKRICTESEWNFACEGETMRPYPYGFSRRSLCNQDRDDLYVPGSHHRKLRDLREPARANPHCVSPFGVYDMVGNLDEPVLRDDVHTWPPFQNALKGGWWMAARNRCRPATTAHDDYYNGIQTGVRCCADVPGAAKNSRAHVKASN